MKTRVVMTLSALFMAVLGLAATFFPQELLASLGTPPAEGPAVLLEAGGALYLAFAVLNWMVRGHLIGGIYGRPVALSNFLHFGVVAISLTKDVVATSQPAAVVVGTLVYAAFALCFGVMLFTHSRSDRET